MGKWEEIYRSLEKQGVNVSDQLAGTAWLDKFIPILGETKGKMLDLGFGLGADMLRCAKLGYEPYGLELEQKAVSFVSVTYGFQAQCHNLRNPLPFSNGTFSLVLSRFALHYLRPAQAENLFKEVRRVLKPEGWLIFAVNSESHRRLGLQYNYTDAKELEPQVWHLPNDKDRTFLFYTPKRAKEILGKGWKWVYLEDEVFTHWDVDTKRAIVAMVQNA